MSQTCPVCGKNIVPASGPQDSPILLVGEFPGFYEFERGHAWAGPAGRVLESELKEVGINLWTCRSTNLWLHEKDNKGCDIEWHKARLIEEFYDRKAILFMGSDVSKTLFKLDISKVNGLPVTDPMLMGIGAVLAYNPAMVNVEGAVLGEFRLAIEKFKEILGDV